MLGVLEGRILEQLGYFILLPAFPFGVHTRVYLQKRIIFIVYIKQYLAVVWWDMFNSSKCLLCI